MSSPIPDKNRRMAAPDKYAQLRAKIIQLLAEDRKRKRISKYQVEQRSGLSQQMVGYVERGVRLPSLETILRMADGIGVKIEDVIAEARSLTSETQDTK